MDRLRKAWREAKFALRKARDRWLGARSYLRDVRKHLAAINLRLGLEAGDERGNGKIRDKIKPGPEAKSKLEEILEERGRLLADLGPEQLS